MKKVLALALGMLLIPFTAFGLQVMSDADMENITGQSGVAISLNDIVIYNQGSNEIWYQTLDTWNVTDAEFKTGASVGIVFNADADKWTMTYINGLFWTNLVAAGTELGTAANPVGSRGQFGLHGNYNSWAGIGAGNEGTWAYHVNTAYAKPNLAAAGLSTATVAESLTPRPLMISVQSGLFQPVSAFFAGIDPVDGISCVLIELGTIEIARDQTETLDIYLSNADNPVNNRVVQTYTAGVPDVMADPVNTFSFGRLYRGDSGITAYLSGDIAIAPRASLFQGETP